MMVVIRVGIDGRSLRYPLTGVGRYTWELTRRLAAMDGLEVEVFAPGLPREDQEGTAETRGRTIGSRGPRGDREDKRRNVYAAKEGVNIVV